MANNLLEALISLGIDRQKANEAVKALGKIESGVEDIEDANKRLGKAANKAGDSIASSVQGARSDVQKLNAEIDSGIDSVERYDKAFKGVADRVSVFGDVDTALSGISGLAGGLGGGAVGGALGGASGIFSAAEQLPRLSVAATELGQRVADAVPILGNATGGLAALGVAGIAAGGAIALVTKLLGEAKEAEQRRIEATQAAIDSALEYYRVIATGSADTAQQQIDATNETIQANQLLIDSLGGAGDALDQLSGYSIQALRDAAKESDGTIQDTVAILQDMAQESPIFGGYAQQAIDFLGEYGDALAENNIAIQDLDVDTLTNSLHDARAAVEQGTTQVERLQGAIDDGVVGAVEDQTQAEQDLTDAAKAATAALLTQAQQAGTDARFYLDAARLTTGQIHQRVTALEDESAAINASLDVLRASGDTSEQVTQQIAAYEDRLQTIGEEHVYLTDTAYALAQAHEAQAAAAKEAEDTLKALADTQASYNADVEKIQQDAADKRASIEEGLTNKLIDIEQARVDALSKAAENLRQKTSDLASGFARGEQDAAAKAAFDRQKSALDLQRDLLATEQDTANKVLEIRKKAADDEFDLIRNRDFAGLFARRRQTNNEIKNTEKAGREAQTEKIKQAQTAQQDAARQAEFDRQQRQQNYTRQLQDAQAQYNREIQQANAARIAQIQKAQDGAKAELSLLQTKLMTELRLRQQSYQSELQLASQGSQARIQLEAQTQQALVAQAQRTLSALSGRTGALGAFQSGQSIFSAISGHGQNIITPAGAGSSIYGGSSNSSAFNQTNNITGNNPQQIANLVTQRTTQLFRQVFGV